MALQKLQFRPGINREITDYSNEGGWFDCDKVRFTKGFPECIEGWQKRSTNSLLGRCSTAHAATSLSWDNYLVFGTNLKLITDIGDQYADITPIGTTSSAGDVTFSATDGSSTIVVTHTDHGAENNNFVTFSGATSLGGNITADILNQEYQITRVIDADSYEIEAREAADILDIVVDGTLVPTPVLANASDTSDGGASVVGTYQIPTGLSVYAPGTGWGTGPWGFNGWGESSQQSLVGASLSFWSIDSYGEDILANPRNGGIYLYDYTAGGRAVDISTLSGANKTPTVASRIIVSDRDRHTIAFGCDPEATPGVRDPMTIRFSSQESLTDWESRATNTAGELRLSSGSHIVTAIETRQQILVFTDTTLYGMQYLGPPFTFGVGSLSEQITVAGPSCVEVANDIVYWMGKQKFYAFSGTVQTLPCTVLDYVFNDFNYDQIEKVMSGHNSRHSEIWWFYPSADSEENDRYVAYNYLEQAWTYGTFDRTAWLDQGVFEYPIAVDSNGYVYDQERGFVDGSVNPPAAIVSYIESSPIDIGDGENFALIRRLMPDVSFKNSTDPRPSVDVTLSVRNFVRAPYNKEQALEFIDPRVAPDDGRTDQLFYRLRGRQMKLRIDCSNRNVTWRLGSPRVDLRQDGRR